MFPGYANAPVDPWKLKHGHLSSNHDLHYTFVTEWYDPYACLVRRYQFRFFPKDNSIEMFDPKHRRKFLTRTKFPSIQLKDLFLGSILSVCSRHLTVVDYGDPYTKRHLGSKNERTLAMIKPDAVEHLGDILNVMRDSELEPQRAKMLLMTKKNAAAFYETHKCQPYFIELVMHMISGPIIAIELRGIEAIKKWRDLIGPVDAAVAKDRNPNLLRAKYGVNDIKNGLHGSDSPEAVSRELEFFFPTKGEFRMEPTTKYDNCSCCVIKPHAVRAGYTGDIVNAIRKEGFQITDIRFQLLEKANAMEFYDVYKGVLLEFPAMVEELSSGVSMALAIYSDEPIAADRFRDFCGPADPEVARHIRPTSLRAVYGEDKIKNAVHCTDMPEDGNVEVEYFFRILSTPV